MLNRAGYREMKRLYEAHGTTYLREVVGALRSEEMSWRDFPSIRSLAEALVPDGAEYIQMINPQNTLNFREAAAVDTRALGIVASNLVFSRMREAYAQPEFVLSRLIPTQPGKPGEIEPWFVDLGDDAHIVPEGEEYPTLTIGTDHIVRPLTQKEGGVVPITREALYEDRTGQVMAHAGKVGRMMALRKEYRLIDTLIGYHRQVGGLGTLWNWRGTEYAPYRTDIYTNYLDSNDLVDHTDIDAIEQLFANMLDPNTGLPVALAGTTCLVCPARKQAASMIFNATEINYGTPTGTDTTSIRKSGNPVSGYSLEVSPHLYRRIIAGGNAGAAAGSAANAGKYYYIGDFAQALCWFEQFGLKVETSGTDSEAAFMRDILMRFKGSHKGAGSWTDPRYIVRGRDAA